MVRMHLLLVDMQADALQHSKQIALSLGASSVMARQINVAMALICNNWFLK